MTNKYLNLTGKDVCSKLDGQWDGNTCHINRDYIKTNTSFRLAASLLIILTTIVITRILIYYFHGFWSDISSDYFTVGVIIPGTGQEFHHITSGIFILVTSFLVLSQVPNTSIQYTQIRNTFFVTGNIGIGLILDELWFDIVGSKYYWSDTSQITALLAALIVGIFAFTLFRRKQRIGD